MQETTERVVSIVKSKPDAETVNTLRQKLKQAEAGELVGCIAAWQYRGREFDADIVGACRMFPSMCVVMVIGMKVKLEALLAALF
jgi:hypothetical protein